MEIVVPFLLILAGALATTGLLFLAAALFIRAIDVKIPGDK